MAPHIASTYKLLTKEDWMDFLKVTNPSGSRIKGALCRCCKNMIKTVSRTRLDAHRKFCPAKNSANYTNEKMDTGETDTAKLRSILDEDLGLFFYSASIAFTQVENPHLKRFIQRLQIFEVNYEPPCRITLGTTIITKVHNRILEKKKLMLQDTDGVLLVDGWRNKSTNRKYLVFSVRNMNAPQTFLTFFDISIEKETGENLRDRIDEAIEIAKADYSCNIYAIVTDNDSKIVLGAKLAKEGSLIRSSCSSHSGNLLIKLFITKDFLDLLRDILSAFRDPKLDSLLLSKGGTKLQNFPDTRFCYLRDTCDSILKNLKHMRELALVEDIGLSEKVTENVIDDNFVNQVTAIVDNLNPICVLINSCQDKECNVADATQLWLSLELPTRDYDDQIAARIEKAVHPVGYAANLLHPTYKGQLLNEEQRHKADAFLNGYLDDVAKQELTRYHENEESYRVCAERFDDPIAFWLYMKHLKEISNLATAAINLMIIPGSTALLEGLFSNWTYVHNLYRNRLGHSKSSKLLDIYYSLKNDLYNDDKMNELMLVEDEDEVQNVHETQAEIC